MYMNIYIFTIYMHTYLERHRERDFNYGTSALKSLTNRTKGILDMSPIRFLKDITLLSL